jgi:4-hydroxy-2-oxoheptanedioate aldolase
MVNVQIEHAEAVKNLDAILATDGLAGIVIGPNDLAGSMGHSGRPDHPEVQKSIDTVISRARAARKFVGIGASAEPEALADWARRGVQWLSVGADFVLLRQAAAQTIAATRAQLALPPNS